MSQISPPRFVPTLTDVVQPGVTVYSQTSASTQAFGGVPASIFQSAGQMEDQIVQRVMQRVDLVLEMRLRDAVGHVIRTHTQALGPRLREEIELVVRESVSQAVAQELPQPPGQ